MTTLERILKYTNKTETCWLWTGSKDIQGYGRMWFEGECTRVHRVLYELIKIKFLPI